MLVRDLICGIFFIYFWNIINMIDKELFKIEKFIRKREKKKRCYKWDINKIF